MIATLLGQPMRSILSKAGKKLDVLKKPLYLNNFNVAKKIKPNHSPPDIGLTYTDPINKQEVGYCQFNPHSGQIGLLRLDDKYRGRSIGTQLMNHIEQELKQNDVPEIWCVSSNKFFKDRLGWIPRVPAHPTVTGHGFYKSISNKYVQ
ncbi:MAG: hypothetical protein Hyperionvirus3_168 [Hyperionvirus sp.]|uniref:N-acetyltransferase domain-containing protein n=1 Tax=Hyperionvirus sp. TaxID=2487770 RepID=A0A3G5A7K2_9VIRU|nr:MAG: hypothetical protein Hyperionvirus3_168 [Hyperionvirus sp.]